MVRSLRSTAVKDKQHKSPKKPISKENGKAKVTKTSSAAPTAVVTNIVKETPKANKSVNCRKCDMILLECDDITSREEHSISCDSCHHWFHRGCTVLTDVEFDFLQECNEAILFKCQDCLETKGAEYKSFSSIESKLNEMMNMMSEMKTQILKEVDDKIVEKLKETQQQEKMESAISIEVKQYIDGNNEDEKERKEIEEKANNIILHHVEEQENESLEKQKVEEIIKILDPQGILKQSTGTLPMKRLGKRKTAEKGDILKPRPLQLVLPDPNSKNGILKNSRNLRDSKYQQISVRPDLTRKQQEIDYKLRQQLRQRKDKKEDVIIYKGEIIQRRDHPNYKPPQIETPPTNTN